MCEDCANRRNMLKADLLGLLNEDEDNELVKAVDRNLPLAMKQINQRIDNAVEHRGYDRPDEEEVREAVRDCLIGAVLATGAAALARATPGYTEEGGTPEAIILGEWAGALLENEISNIMQDHLEEMLRNRLGMGDN